MKNLLIASFSILFSLFTFSCSSSTSSSSGDSLNGKWVEVKNVSIEENETYEVIFNPEAEDYYSAEILEVSNSILHVYFNESGNNYVSLNFPYTQKGDMLFISFTPGTNTVLDTIFFSFENGRLIIENREQIEGFTQVNKTYYEKYTGIIPPDSWTKPLKNDSYEPDNNATTASQISVGSSAQTHTITASDEDWLKFNATAGKKYLLLVTGIMDNVLTLFNTDQVTEIAEDDDNFYDYDIPGVGNVESVLVWECQNSGEYFFRVIGFDNEDEGYYSTSVSLTTLSKTAAPVNKSHLYKKNKANRLPLFFRKRH